MKIKRYRQSKSLRTILPVACIAVILGLSLYLFIYSSKNTSHVATSDTSQSNSNTIQDENAKKDDLKVKQDFQQKANDSEDRNPGVTVPNASNSESITIHAAKSTSDVVISTELNEYPSGTCHLRIINGEKSYSADAGILYQPSFSTCQGFTVPIAELGIGKWQIFIDATPSGGSTNTNHIDFEVK